MGNMGGDYHSALDALETLILILPHQSFQEI